MDFSSSRVLKSILLRIERLILNLSDYLGLSVRDFSWKVRWRMRNDRNPLFIMLQDKYKVKEYARERGIRTAETYHVTDRPETIPFDYLPANYYIKANHGCRWNIACVDHVLYLYEDGKDLIGKGKFSQRRITRDECVRICRFWLANTYSRNEWAYQHIAPLIIVEEALQQIGGGALRDYRCFTFLGVVKAIQITSPIFKAMNQNMFVDTSWRDLKLTVYREQIPDPRPSKPENLQEIVNAAEKLGAGLDFARIDLYDTTCGIVLAEFAIYPEGGDKESPTACPVFNRWLGDQWILATQ